MCPIPDKPTRRRWPWAEGLLVVVFVLYPLSFGPLVWVAYRYKHDPVVMEWLLPLGYAYAPLDWMRSTSEAFDDLMRWYVLLWIG